MVIGAHAVELRCRLIVIRAPVVAPVEAHLGATVITDDHAVTVFRIYPKVVVIAMGCIDAVEGLAPVHTFLEFHVQYIYQVSIFRIHEHFAVIPCPLADIIIAALQCPGFSSVIAHVQSSIRVLHQRVHLVGIGGAYRDAHDTPETIG